MSKPKYPLFIIKRFRLMKKQIEIHKIDVSSSLPLQFANEGIKAGFPSPAQDYLEQAIDLNKELIKHPASTFYGRVVGDSMRDEGIEEGDILVIDKSLELLDDDLAVCFIDGEFTVKRVRLEPDAAWLVPSNTNYPPIKVTKDNEFMVWGIVTYTINQNSSNRYCSASWSAISSMLLVSGYSIRLLMGSLSLYLATTMGVLLLEAMKPKP